MKLLVTGGCGFIGSHFIRHILNTYPTYEVVNFDFLSYAGKIENTNDFSENKKHDLYIGDICCVEEIDYLVKDCDVVINFAAESHVDNSISDSREFIRTNIQGVHVLLDLVTKYNKRMIQISTDEVYGSMEFGEAREHSPLEPNSPYSASKASADLLCRAYHKTHGTQVVVTRSTNNFGSHQHIEKFIPKAITNALKDIPIPVYGDGLNKRDWIYVTDNCRAIDIILHNFMPGLIYNIGAGNEYTNIDVVTKILDIMGKSHDLVTMVDDRKGHDRRYAVNTYKITYKGFKPNVTFEDGLKKTIDWYRNNKGE